MLYRFLIFLFAILGADFGFAAQIQHSCDLLVFSYDRPMQLFAFLESVETRAKNLQNIHVLYRVSPPFETGYEIVFNRFSYIHFVRQATVNPKVDFKSKVLELAFGNIQTKADYIAFAVDDLILTDEIDFQEGVQMLQETNAYGLYYRLGKNINYCKMHRCSQPPPPLFPLTHGYHCWAIETGTEDWGYPNTLDLTIYKKADIQNEIASAQFGGPNELEGRWPAHTNRIGICCEKSKVVNIILNTVSDSRGPMNRLTSPFALNRLFLSGFKIDINQFYQLCNNSPHIDFQPTFISR